MADTKDPTAVMDKARGGRCTGEQKHQCMVEGS